jgi:hypothetical protein
MWHRTRETNFDHNTLVCVGYHEAATSAMTLLARAMFVGRNYQMFHDLSEALGSVTAPAPAFLVGVGR